MLPIPSENRFTKFNAHHVLKLVILNLVTFEKFENLAKVFHYAVNANPLICVLITGTWYLSLNLLIWCNVYFTVCGAKYYLFIIEA